MTRIHDLPAAHPATAVALVEDDGTPVTFGALREAAAAMAEALAAHGVRRGDRLMVVGENDSRFAAAVLAASRLGAWAVPVNARQSPDELDAIERHAGARCALFAADASPATARHAVRLGAAPLAGFGAAVEVTPTAPAEPEPSAADPAGDVAALVYTTGTTSAPKGVMLTHGNLCSAARLAASIRSLSADDEVLCTLPATHIFGFAAVMLAGLGAGCTTRFHARFSADRALAALRDGVTVLPAVPQMFERILALLSAAGEPPRAPRLRYLSSGGAPLEPDLKERTERVLGLPLYNGYGLTETCSGVVGTRPGATRADTSVGTPFEGVSVRIDTPDADGVGEILVAGPGVMKGYYRDPAGTAAALTPDGWLRTGDLGRMDANGALHVVGRIKELIVRSGFNVHPPEVEAMLTRHPDVAQAAVVGRRRGGDEEILAFVILHRDVPEVALKDFLRAHLVHYKVPHHLFAVDAFPAAATGKILKHKLIGHFQELIASREAADDVARLVTGGPR